MDSTPSPPTITTGPAGTLILGALAQLNSPMDGLDPSVTDPRGTEPRLAVITAVPDTVADLELESTLVIDEEAEEMFDGVDVPVDGLAEYKPICTKEPAEAHIVDPLAKRESMAWDLLRPYAAALWKVNC